MGLDGDQGENGDYLGFPSIVLTKVGSVVFGGPSGVLFQDSNFFWDNTNKRLGIGNATPTVPLDVTGEIKTSTTLTASTSVMTPLVSSMTGVNLGFGINSVQRWFVDAGSFAFLPTIDNTFSVGDAGHRVASVSTPAIDSGTTGPLALKTNNGEFQLQILHTASVANPATVTGGTAGNHPVFAAPALSSTKGIAIEGTNGTDNAASGQYGEYTETVVNSASAVSLTNNGTFTIATVALGPGDWDVEGIVALTFGLSTSYTRLIIGVTDAGGFLLGNTFLYKAASFAPGSSDDPRWLTPRKRYSLSGTTNINLTVLATFVSGTLKAYGIIRARRIR